MLLHREREVLATEHLTDYRCRIVVGREPVDAAGDHVLQSPNIVLLALQQPRAIWRHQCRDEDHHKLHGRNPVEGAGGVLHDRDNEVHVVANGVNASIDKLFPFSVLEP